MWIKRRAVSLVLFFSLFFPLLFFLFFFPTTRKKKKQKKKKEGGCSDCFVLRPSPSVCINVAATCIRDAPTAPPRFRRRERGGDETITRIYVSRERRRGRREDERRDDADETRTVGGTNFHRRVQRTVRRRRVASYLREKRVVRERVLVYVPE